MLALALSPGNDQQVVISLIALIKMFMEEKGALFLKSRYWIHLNRVWTEMIEVQISPTVCAPRTHLLVTLRSDSPLSSLLLSW